jgi:hypothetical protein
MIVVVLAALGALVAAACYVDANLDMTNMFEVVQGQRKIGWRAHSETKIVDGSLESRGENIQFGVEVENGWKFLGMKAEFSVRPDFKVMSRVS